VRCSLVSSLIRKYRLAIKGEDETKRAYQGLSDSLNPEWMAEWSIAEGEAIQLRGDLLMILSRPIQTFCYQVVTGLRTRVTDNG
jgi:hypothetical protein